MKNPKLLFAILLSSAIALSIALIILLKVGKEPISSGCIERQSSHIVTLNGASVLAFNSVPKEVVKSLKTYIKDNDYNGKDLQFVFLNSPFTNISGRPLSEDVYCVVQCKLNKGDIDYKYNRRSIYIGELLINKNGKVIKTQNLLTVKELSDLKTTPSVSFAEAADIAKNYLNEEPPLEEWSWTFCTPYNDDEWVLCYKIKFRESGNTVYIDGFGGEVISEVRI